MKKVVINTCYGGFSLSNEGTCRFAELKGLTLHVKESCRLYTLFYTSPTFEEDTYFTNRPDNREDPDLVKVVEELEERSWGNCAELKVVEIPDDVEYTIEEYDGFEWIAEVHQTWS